MTPETTNQQQYIKYGRKNGIRHLKILIETLKDPEAIKAANNAYNYLDGRLRHQRFKGTGRYS